MVDRPDPTMTDKEAAREWIDGKMGTYRGHDVVNVIKEALDKDGDDDKGDLQPEEG